MGSDERSLFGYVGNLLTGIIALLAFILAVAEYIHSREIESRKPFFEMKQQVYSEVLEISAQLANHDEIDLSSLKEKFEVFRWGLLPLVQTDEVQASIECFKKAYENQDADILSNVYRLAYNMRVDLVNSWDIDKLEYLPPLGGDVQPDNLVCYPDIEVSPSRSVWRTITSRVGFLLK